MSLRKIKEPEPEPEPEPEIPTTPVVYKCFNDIFEDRQESLRYYWGRYRDLEDLNVHGGQSFKIQTTTEGVTLYVWFYKKNTGPNEDSEFVSPKFIQDADKSNCLTLENDIDLNEWSCVGWGPSWKQGSPIFYKKHLNAGSEEIIDFTQNKTLLVGFGVIPDSVALSVVEKWSLVTEIHKGQYFNNPWIGEEYPISGDIEYESIGKIEKDFLNKGINSLTITRGLELIIKIEIIGNNGLILHNLTKYYSGLDLEFSFYYKFRGSNNQYSKGFPLNVLYHSGALSAFPSENDWVKVPNIRIKDTSRYTNWNFSTGLEGPFGNNDIIGGGTVIESNSDFPNTLQSISMYSSDNKEFKNYSDFKSVKIWVKTKEISSGKQPNWIFFSYNGEEKGRIPVQGRDLEGDNTFYSRISSKIIGDFILICSNGIPDYIPIAGNILSEDDGVWDNQLSSSSNKLPNYINQTIYVISIPTKQVTNNPVQNLTDDFDNFTETQLEQIIGVSLNGVPFLNPWNNTNGKYLSVIRDSIPNSHFDNYGGHPSGESHGLSGIGPYHYHKYSSSLYGSHIYNIINNHQIRGGKIYTEEEMTKVFEVMIQRPSDTTKWTRGNNAHSLVLGYMMDGYPIYGPIGTDDLSTWRGTSSLVGSLGKILTSSYAIVYELEIIRDTIYIDGISIGVNRTIEVKRGTPLAFYNNQFLTFPITFQSDYNNYQYLGNDKVLGINEGVLQINNPNFKYPYITKLNIDQNTPDTIYLVCKTLSSSSKIITGITIKVVDNFSSPDNDTLSSKEYTYIQGYGHLDKCNAIFSPTPDFPTGCYHYVLPVKRNNNGTLYKEINPNYLYSGTPKKIYTTAYPHTTVYLRGSQIGSVTDFNNLI